MTTHLPQLPLEIDPLIAEAKERARRRRQFAGLALLGVVAVATVMTLGLRPGGFTGRAATGSAASHAKATEIAAIERAIRGDASSAATAKLWFTRVHISAVDPRYAWVELRYTAKCPGCTVRYNTYKDSQGGQDMVRRDASGWHVIFAGSQPPWCGTAPAAVYRELVGIPHCLVRPKH